jgi:5-oxoprolinase (ATP-hydrolysing) subunit A
MTQPATPVIDLNSDLGEGFGAWTMGDDEALLEIVSSANIACGFHAGDPRTMRRVCARAAENGVAVGAHVAYRDLAGFGRRPMAVPPDELVDDILYQLAALDGFARVAGTRVSYVKPHGALYNTVADDQEQAAALAEAVRLFDPGLAVVGLAGSPGLKQAAAAGLRTVEEAFADRGYTPDGRLLPRSRPGSVIHDVDAIVARCLDLARYGTVAAADGGVLRLAPGSLCVHGDTPGAVRIARAIRSALLDAGVRIAPFAPAPTENL